MKADARSRGRRCAVPAGTSLRFYSKDRTCALEAEGSLWRVIGDQCGTGSGVSSPSRADLPTPANWLAAATMGHSRLHVLARAPSGAREHPCSRTVVSSLYRQHTAGLCGSGTTATHARRGQSAGGSLRPLAWVCAAALLPAPTTRSGRMRTTRQFVVPSYYSSRYT